MTTTTNLTFTWANLKAENGMFSDLFGSDSEQMRAFLKRQSEALALGKGNRAARRAGWYVRPTAGPDLARETRELMASI